ncbi:ATP-binding protein [Filobacillus milosensis]|uniref:ATP-binding protein n=1 Tax=Filobacillus milosensis TaxID=94137 RepID=A0A4Y8IIB3_9BACI|nr:AAA family ATPase [Filobacillus milosensis]TFB19548.1 ATP-binding protein [Filobacillus milosensis]
MNRLAIITVGKTHSGKTTFARKLEEQLPNSVVIDQDNHAEFINAYYKKLIPSQGPNNLKYTITQTMVDYTIKQTDYHLIKCNSNRNQKSRLDNINYYKKNGFITIIVYFNLPEQVLNDRVKHTKRSTNIFRTASSFEEVLERQGKENDVKHPTLQEADYLYEIKSNGDVQDAIAEILEIKGV